MSDTALRTIAWLLTYALHSTVLLGFTALLTRRVRSEAWRETLWKAALLGGLLTATVQTAGWMDGDAGQWRLAVLPAAESTGIQSPVSTATIGATNEAATAETGQPPRESAIAPDLTVLPQSEQAALNAAPPPSSASNPAPVRVPGTPLGWAVLAWAIGAAVMLLRMFWRHVRLRRLLADRSPVEDGAVLAMLAELRRSAGIGRPVRLTACPATPTPLALGGGEICVPPRFLTGLDPEQQRSALAHELAHLARRDPAWHLAASALEAVFFFQPLNRLARTRLRESAEFLCDAWAARQTGSPLGLARCLAEVASWMAPGRHPIPAGTLAMAEGGSPLVERVRRLTTWRGEPREGSAFLRFAAGLLLVSAVAAVAPAIASTDEAKEAREPASASTPVVIEAATDGQEIVVIRHPDPDQPLDQRWTWALGQMAERRMERAWIAWSVPTRLPDGTGWITDSGDFRIDELGRTPLNAVLRAPAEHAVLLFTVARDGDLKRVTGRRAAGMDTGGLPVLWLGTARDAASFAQLRGMADRQQGTDLRESLVEMVGLHPVDDAVPYLAAVLGRDGSSGVRREAASALGLHPTDEALTALRTAVERDGSDDVRREAVEAIGRMGTDASAALLAELAVRGRDRSIRRTAVESLAKDNAQGVEMLSSIALGDPDPVVARQAVEEMGHAPAALAAPVLVELAWTGPDRVIQRQAAESLGGLPASWAIPALDSIARLHPNSAVAQQAAESLGGYPDAVAGGYLRQLARTHPDSNVREEALDQLREARGDGADPDPDPDADLDPGSDPDPDPSSRPKDRAAAP